METPAGYQIAYHAACGRPYCFAKLECQSGQIIKSADVLLLDGVTNPVAGSLMQRCQQCDDDSTRLTLEAVDG